MVIDISEARLIFLFIEGLTKPLKGLVKAYQPSTLLEAVGKTRDMQDAIPRTKYPPKTPITHKFQNQTPPMRKLPAPGKKKYSYKYRDELRRKKLYFSYQETLGSRLDVCQGKGTLY